jgi:hypothetical protein
MEENNANTDITDKKDPDTAQAATHDSNGLEDYYGHLIVVR